MIFKPTKLAGVVVVDLEKRVDERGYFARAWCEKELASAGLSTRVTQINVGFSSRKGTLRGLHYQRAPHAETKLVRCTRGAVFDVAVDLRKESPTYLQWVGVELTADNGRALHIPEDCAHGYFSLVDNAEILYTASCEYHAGSATGVRFDDPLVGVEWPGPPAVISDADRNWPALER